jgi:hypothetical protein
VLFDLNSAFTEQIKLKKEAVLRCRHLIVRQFGGIELLETNFHRLNYLVIIIVHTKKFLFQRLLLVSKFITWTSITPCISIQGDSYSFINILTSGRFWSQKALDNKILSHS